MPLSIMEYDTVILNGISLQNYDTIGVDILKGAGEMPAPMYASGQLTQAHGAWATKSYMTPKTFTIGGWVAGGSTAQRDSLVQQVADAASIDDGPFTYAFNDSLVTYTVRRASEFLVDEIDTYTARFQFAVTAMNPIGRLGGQFDSDSGRLTRLAKWQKSIITDGLKFPIGGTGIHFSASSLDDGAIFTQIPGRGAALTFTVTGPITAPAIVTLNKGNIYTLRWDYLTLTAGQTLVVDVDARSSLINGATSAPPTVRQWPGNPAGDTTFRIVGTAGDSNTSLTATVEPWI